VLRGFVSSSALAFSLGAAAVSGASAQDALSRTLITNVRVFDGRAEQLRDYDVLVEGNLIARIGANVNAPRGATVIDAGGRIMTPGFIDAHTHMALIAPFDQLENEYSGVYVGAAAGQMAEDMLMRGFTTVRDAGGASIGVQRAIDDGWFKGPRIFSSGAFLTQTSGHLDMHDRNEPHRHVGGGASRAEQIGHFITVDGADEVLGAVRENFRQGATQIKLATNGGVSAVYSPLDLVAFTDEELAAAVWAAGSFGSYVMAHVYYDDAVSRTIDAGARSIEHGHLMSDTTMRKMAEQDVFLVVEALMSVADAPPSFTPDQREKFELVKSGFEGMIESAKRHGVRIAFGSDVFLSREAYELQAMEWVARSRFFTPLEILKQATSIGAELIALSGLRNRYREGPLGVIEEGAYADLLLIEGDPLEDITILSRPDESLRLIMKDGVIYKNTLNER
jgi:imidazolonepropionase-like amidohydrolase